MQPTVKYDYKIGDAAVLVDTIADDQVHYISETPCNHGSSVTLNGYRYTTGVEFIRPATLAEIKKCRRLPNQGQ